MAKVDFDASSSALIGTDIGPYRLVRRLGMGGMAETFVAIRRGPQGFTQRVCLKLVLPFHREDEEFQRLFQREARLAAKLRHSNIVGIIDFGEVAGRSYMAIELVDGVDLRVLLDAQSGKRLSPDHVALLGQDLASALEHAHNPPHGSDLDGGHAGPIVHRDISPSNVLISRHGEVKLGDFGVAKALTGNSGKQSAVKGKVPYMSPEQLRLETLDGRADLFGVGVVLFEALCGQRPYEGGHDPGTIMLILEGTHQPLASLAPGAPPELCALIERLIEPDRENRPESAAELIELLDPFVPSPRERRKLGKRVAELQPEERAIDSYPPSFGEDPTERHEDAGDSEAEKRTSGIVGPGESRERVSWSEGEISPRATSEKAGKRAKILGAFSLAVALLVAAAIAWWSTRDSGEEIEASPIGAEPRAVDEVEARQESPSEEPPGAQPEELERADKEAVVEERMDDDVESASLEAEARPARNPVKRASPAPAVPPASLTVVVYPWGDVWINGKPRGAGPLRNLSLKPGRYRIAAGQGEPVVSQTIRLRSGEERKIKLDVTK